MGRQKIFKVTKIYRDILGFTLLIPLSLFFFYLHLNEGRTIPHVLLFYPFNLCFLFGFLYGCKLLSNYKTDIIFNISIGTLLIIGLHFPIIGIYNYLTGHTCYHWYEAIPTALLITAILYPFIIHARNNYPPLIGKKRA